MVHVQNPEASDQWHPPPPPPPPRAPQEAPSIGNLEQELLGIWEDSSNGDGSGGGAYWPGGKRGGGTEGRGSRRGASGDFHRRGGGAVGEGGGIARAVSDEDLFESLFGDQRGGAGIDGGGGAAELAGA